jgi:hypothetical protein
MRIVLRIASGPEAGQEVSFGPGETKLVGRARNADVRLAEDPYLSDLHVGFYVDEAGVCVVRDLYSSNGTLLNDEALEEAVLKDGDRVTAGETEIEVRIEGEEEVEEVEAEEVAEPEAAEASVEEVLPYPGIPAVPIEETIVLQEPAKVAVAVAAKGAVPSWVARPVPAATPAVMPEPPPLPTPEPAFAPVVAPVVAPPAFIEIPEAPLPPALLPRVILNVPEVAPPPPPPEDDADLDSDRISAFETDIDQILDRAKEPLFALLDAAKDNGQQNSVLRLVSEAGSEAMSLYSGRRAERLASAAPYLVRITGRIPRFIYDFWQKTSGIVFASTSPLGELRAHFKRLLIVETEARDTVYFRFYEPRVLRILLPSCTPAQARRFFGPVAWFLVEGKAGSPPERFVPPPPPAQNGASGEPIEPERELFGLRDEQMELFRRDAIERFIERMVARLKREHMKDVAAWPSVEAAVREAIPRAEGYGISSEDDLERFMHLMAVLGPKFDQDEAWAGEILRERVTGVPRRLAALKKALTERRLG